MRRCVPAITPHIPTNVPWNRPLAPWEFCWRSSTRDLATVSRQQTYNLRNERNRPPPCLSKRQYLTLLPQEKLPPESAPNPTLPKLTLLPHHQAQLKQAERTWDYKYLYVVVFVAGVFCFLFWFFFYFNSPASDVTLTVKEKPTIQTADSRYQSGKLQLTHADTREN